MSSRLRTFYNLGLRESSTDCNTIIHRDALKTAFKCLTVIIFIESIPVCSLCSKFLRKAKAWKSYYQEIGAKFKNADSVQLWYFHAKVFYFFSPWLQHGFQSLLLKSLFKLKLRILWHLKPHSPASVLKYFTYFHLLCSIVHLTNNHLLHKS